MASTKLRDLTDDFEVSEDSKGEAIRFTEQDASTFDYHRVWTVVEGDGNCVHEVYGDDPEDREPCDCLEHQWYALPGYHLVNRLHYVISDKPWKDNIDYPDYLAP